MVDNKIITMCDKNDYKQNQLLDKLIKQQVKDMTILREQHSEIMEQLMKQLRQLQQHHKKQHDQMETHRYVVLKLIDRLEYMHQLLLEQKVQQRQQQEQQQEQQQQQRKQ
ncbi:uncharacterized protein [Prorops nasuta]|uniref:uncharacterized protein n=1 Tax=Prorops nasuta TaxID=863751 RepID=UPI0034CE3445